MPENKISCMTQKVCPGIVLRLSNRKTNSKDMLMLEIKSVTKIYRTKAGETRALDGVSVAFPEKGMVFVLGKSGCGKSTLLNVCGGLDIPDSGEVCIKGRSTKDFTETDYDSYRNTCVGFVFQEYNILSEFSVEDNIALALELQGKPKDPIVIADILRQVELESVAKRKPNTLSGGQKQRVAIARALIKNPEIIMADEPTGALDSVTGRQVFDTLKKLSRDKLVIVVSHDREFAELYADRIIELKDGKVISDVVKTTEAGAESKEKLTFVGEDTVLVKKGATLEKEDVKKLNAFLSSSDCDVLVSKKSDEIEKYKKNANISAGGERVVFRESDSSPEVRTYTDEERKLIRSRLPLRRALKIGASGMKVKPVRFAFTLLLSIIAFTMFGMFSTIMFYDPVTVAINSLRDTDEQYLSLSKNMITYVYEYEKGELKETSESYNYVNYTDDDIAALREKYGSGIVPIYDIEGMSFNNYKTSDDFYFRIYSFAPAEQVQVTYTKGRAPETENEIVLSEYALSELVGYRYNQVTDFDDIVLNYKDFSLTVCGIYETPLTSERLVVDSSMPVSFSTPGDNFLLTALVTNDFYLKVNEAAKSDYYTDNSVKSYCSSVVASVKTDGYTTAHSVQIDNFAKSNVFPAADTLAADGSEATSLGDGIAVSYRIWSDLLVPDLETKVKEKGLDDLFCAEDSDGESLKSKYAALSQSAFYTTAERATAKDYLSDLLSFCNDYGLVEYNSLTFYDSDKNAIATKNVTAVIYGGDYTYSAAVILDDATYAAVREAAIKGSYFFQEFVTDFDYVEGDYSGVLIPVADDYQRLSELVRGKRVNDGNDASYDINNANYSSVSSVSNTVSMLTSIFLYTGIGVAVFAALLLFNFISVSITDKKREIGILRAVGAKSSDVFKIFLSESMIIVLICALVSAIATAITCAAINAKLSTYLGITFSLFSFGILSVLMIFGIAAVTAVISTLLPVYTFSKKKPVDTIRDL